MLPATTKSSNDFGFVDSDSLALWERVRVRAERMSNKIFCLALCALLFALSFSAEAQQQAKVPKIGWLSEPVPLSSPWARAIPARAP